MCSQQFKIRSFEELFMVLVGNKSQTTLVINHCKRIGKTDYLKKAIHIARKKGLLDKKNRLTKDGHTIVLMSNFHEHVTAGPWKDYWSR